MILEKTIWDCAAKGMMRTVRVAASRRKTIAKWMVRWLWSKATAVTMRERRVSRARTVRMMT